MEPKVSLNIAAKMAGKTTTAIRRWVTQGTVKAKKNEKGRWEVNTQSLREHLAINVPVNVGGSSGKTSEPDLQSEYIRSLQSSLERERKKVDDLAENNTRLQNEILKLTHEIKAILSKDSRGLLSRWIKSS